MKMVALGRVRVLKNAGRFPLFSVADVKACLKEEGRENEEKSYANSDRQAKGTPQNEVTAKRERHCPGCVCRPSPDSADNPQKTDF